jgi:histidine racemase
MKKINKFTIAGGNTTVLIGGVSCSPSLTKQYLKIAEQVGFTRLGTIPKLTMMGNELSVNGTIAFASTLKQTGFLQTSGIRNLVWYKNTRSLTTIKIPINYRRLNNYIFLEGIGYLVSNEKISNLAQFLDQACTTNNFPAFGKIEYKYNKLVPYVYVRKTQSLVKETACGSGSLAYFIINAASQIIQPTGQKIIITSDSDFFYITAKVKTC